MENSSSRLFVENFQMTDIEDEVGKVEIVAKDGQTFVIAYQEEEVSTKPKLKCLRCAFECTKGDELVCHVDKVHSASTVLRLNPTIRRSSNKPLVPIKEIQTKTSSKTHTEKSLHLDHLEKQYISQLEGNIPNKILPCTRHCFMCSKTFKTREALHLHFEKDHSPSQPSPIVNRRKEKKPKTIDLTSKHDLPKQPDKPNTTGFVPGEPDTCCGQPFESILDLGKHQINHHGSFYCTHCSVSFPNFHVFNRHVEKHNTTCKKCNVFFPTKIKLNEHLLNHKPEESNHLIGGDIEEETDLTTNFILKPTIDANDFIKDLSDWMKNDKNGEKNVVSVEIVEEADDENKKNHEKSQKKTKVNQTKLTFLGIPHKIEDEVLSTFNHNEDSNVLQTFPNLQSNQTKPTAKANTQSKLEKVKDYQCYQCGTCFKPFFSAVQLQKHFMATHMEVPVKKLGKLVKNSKDNSASQQIANKRSYRCDLCDTSYKHNDSLTIHQRMKHSVPKSTGKSPKLECEFCAEIIPDHEQLEEHKYQKHMIPRKRRSEAIAAN